MNTVKKSPLGRGLGALIEGVEKEVLEKKVEVNLQIDINSIDSNPFSRVRVLMLRHRKSLRPQYVSWVLSSR